MNRDTQFKTEDAASYDDVADIFDRLTLRYAAQSAVALARAVDAPQRRCILDIGCGTGLVAFKAAEMSGPETRIIGIDLSEGMLRRATAAVRTAGLTDRVSFQSGDAEALDLTPGMADGYVSLNAYSHFPHPDRAATEAFRVLAPGGRIAVGIGSGPQLLSVDGLRRAIRAVQRKSRIARGRERVACTQLEGLVAQHLRAVPDPEVSAFAGARRDFSHVLGDLLRGAGFADVRRHWTGADFVIPTIEDFWLLQTTISTPSRKRMALASQAGRDAVKAAFWADCTAVLHHGGQLTYSVGAAIVTARKPG